MNAEDRLIESIRVPVKKEALKIAGYRINCVSAGVGQPVILLHGLNIGWGQWHQNFNYLAKYFRVYALDLPGSGRSSNLNFKKDPLVELVSVVGEFIKRKKIRRPNIVAHSLSAALTIKLAASGRIKLNKLVLVDPLGFSTDIPNKQKLITIKPLATVLSKTIMRSTRKNMRIFLAEMLKDKKSLNDELVDYFYEAIKRDGKRHPLLFMNNLTSFMKLKDEIVVVSELSRIKQRVLIIVGQKDAMLPYHKVLEASKLLSRARVVVMKNSGHVPNLEKADQFNREVTKFLTSKG